MEEQIKCPFFSIIMPTYNVEAYIGHAIRSIREQSYGDWEIVVVDDCSTDNSAGVVEQFMEEDRRIRMVRHRENRGLSAARNTGILEAKGEYIWFMDPDDYVDSVLLEKVKASLEENPAEVVLFGLVEEYYNKDGSLEYTNSIIPQELLCHEQVQLRKSVIYLEQQTLYGYAWNKIYKLDYIKKQNIFFEDVRLIEDIVFNITVFAEIKGLNLLAFAPYHYAKRLGANLTNKFVPEYFELHRRRIELLYHQHVEWNLCTANVRQILGSLYGRYILSALERNCDRRTNMSMSDRFFWCKELFAQELFEILIPGAKARDSRVLRIALSVLKMKNPVLCMMMGRGIHIIRTGLPTLYSKTKSER